MKKTANKAAAMYSGGKSEKPTLRFGPGDLSGFTSTGLTGYQDLNPSAVVRELVQNSLDAAVEAGEPIARVCFILDTCSIDQIPGIEEFREAFSRAVKSHSRRGSLPDQARAVVRTIEDCLEGDKCDVLSVCDNGIGLDSSRMRALLGDGISVKAPGATGAFGNGHVVAIPASDLRYVLYGGVANGKEIASGHAILAAHEDSQGGAIRSKDGFFVEELRTNSFSAPFKFVSGRRIPGLIKDQLKNIRQRWSHGTAVVIPGFNRFKEEEEGDPLWRLISKAIACSFFAAIESEGLSIEVVESGQARVLDRGSVEQVLEQHSVEKRTRGIFLSGSRAYEAYLTMREGSRIELATDVGGVVVYFRVLSEGGITRCSLCRNGMWITDDLPGFYGQFSDRRAFQAVILLDSTGGEFHSLVRKAEGPLHNGLSLKYLDPVERKKLRSAFNAIRSRLRSEVPPLDEDEYRPSDVFTIQTVGDATVASGGARPSVIGQPSIVQSRRSMSWGSDQEVQEKAPKGRQGRAKLRKPQRGGRPLQFQALPVPVGARAYRVEIVPDEDCQGSELRLALDENLDVTCDAISRDSGIAISKAILDGREVKGGDLVRSASGDVYAVMLGNLKKGNRYLVDLEYSLPTDLVLSDEEGVVLKVEIVRRASATADNVEKKVER